MPEQTLADLMREVGMREDRPRAPRAAVWDVMNAPRPPLPRTRADLQAAQDNQFAQQRLAQQREAFNPGIDRSLQRDHWPGRPSVAVEAGQMMLENTGLPSMQRSGEAFRSGEPLRGAGELGMGLLGVAGTAGGLMSMAPRAMPRAPTPPARPASVPDGRGAGAGQTLSPVDRVNQSLGQRISIQQALDVSNDEAMRSFVIDGRGRVFRLGDGKHQAWERAINETTGADPYAEMATVSVFGDSTSIRIPDQLSPSLEGAVRSFLRRAESGSIIVENSTGRAWDVPAARRMISKASSANPPNGGPLPDPNAVTRLPANPSREIGPNGLPIRPREPFRNSLRGGSDDLREAARPQSSSALALPQSVAQIGRARGAAGMARYRYAPPEAPRGTAWDFVVEPDDANPGMFSVQMQLKQNGQSVPIDAALGSASPEEAFGIYRALQETLAADAVAHNRPGYYITGSGRLRDLHERFAERAERMGLLPEGYRFIPAQGRMPARVMRDEAMLPKPPDAPKQNTPRKPPPGGFFNFGAR